MFGVSGVGVHDGSRGGVCFLGWCGAALPVLGGAGVVDAVCRAGLTRATDLIYIGESAKIPLSVSRGPVARRVCHECCRPCPLVGNQPVQRLDPGGVRSGSHCLTAPVVLVRAECFSS